MTPSDTKSQFSALTALGLVGQVGLAVAVPMVAGVLAGSGVDQYLGGAGLGVLAGVLAGLLAGGFCAFRILAREIPDRGTQHGNDVDSDSTMHTRE